MKVSLSLSLCNLGLILYVRKLKGKKTTYMFTYMYIKSARFRIETEGEVNMEVTFQEKINLIVKGFQGE